MVGTISYSKPSSPSFVIFTKVPLEFAFSYSKHPSPRVGGVSALQVIEVMELQSWNAKCPILVTEFGIVTEVSLEQCQYLQLTVYQFVLFKTVEKLFRGFY